MIGFRKKNGAADLQEPTPAYPEISTHTETQATSMATGCLLNVRLVAAKLYALRRRIATITVALLAGLLFVHVMFGVNGMVIYKQKRSDYVALQKRIAQEKTENDTYRQQIESMKTDARAIEKEAREQLRYVRPGEYIYVQPAPVNPPPANHSAKR